MRILTDDPRPLAPLLLPPRAVNLQPIILSPHQQTIWNTLNALPPILAAELALPFREDPQASLLYVHKATASQFDQLLTLLHNTPPLTAPLITLAGHGQGFHGQRGRPWVALPGNLHLCAAYPVHRTLTSLRAGLSMLPALAVADCLPATLAPAIKWRNDILIQGRKIAGVLTATQCRKEMVEHVLFGIGINLLQTPALPPDPYTPPPAHLSQFLPAPITLPDLLLPLLQALHNRLQQLLQHGPDPLHRDYLRACPLIGQTIQIHPESDDTAPIITGKLLHLDLDLALHLQGHPTPLHRGRLMYSPPAA